ncbi:hypothetical protein BE221DRAFT_68165 [Ostreococcus tauri]|uniref:Uncharacterized protein n=1 Tax=Ostreococcus tauri TaxID=70448 RepID=A0A1Y5IJK9_OSTTA|nr:hypothetical protein BE221DRAFT_68165 [Ostreococcus tauri]
MRSGWSGGKRGTTWPSGLRRRIKAPVRKSAGSNPVSVSGVYPPFVAHEDTRPVDNFDHNSDLMTELCSLGLTVTGSDNFIPRVMRKRLTAHFHNFSITSSRSRVVNHRVGLCVIKMNGHLGKLRGLSSRG